MKAYQNQLLVEKEATQSTASNQLSSGLTVDEQAWTVVQSKKKKKSKAKLATNQDESESITQILKALELNNHCQERQAKEKKSTQKTVKKAEQGIAVNPKKKLRNLKKKLKDIEALMKVDRKKLEKDQIDKIGRYEEVKKQINILETELCDEIQSS